MKKGVNSMAQYVVIGNGVAAIGFFGLHAMTAGSYYTTDEGGELYEEKTNNTLCLIPLILKP